MEKGSKVSGGQLQRVGIARALYNDPQILIFDESTSSLDAFTEKEIMKNIYRFKEHKTLIIISHKLDLLKNCNEVYELKQKNYLKFKFMINKNFIRIIPKLDIKNGMLIKGINLEGLRVLGNPFNFAKYYYNNLADEICYIDNVATLYGTNNLSNFISDTAKNIFVPISVGGGIRSLQDIEESLKLELIKFVLILQQLTIQNF